MVLFGLTSKYLNIRYNVNREMAAHEPSPSRLEELIERTGDALEEGRYPLEITNDRELYELELRRIFAQSWIYLGHVSEFQEPGDYARRYIGEDPYIVTRDENGELHAFLDSCLHRGAQFCTAEKGNTSFFRCPYHGWTYKNDGTLQGMPHMKEAYQDLDESEVELEEAHLEIFKGLIFGRIADEGPSLEEYLGDFKWYLEMLFGTTEEGMVVVGDAHRWESEHDWKVSADNFSGDSYHVLTTHQAGIETEDLDWDVWSKIDGSMEDASYLACADNHSVGYYITENKDDTRMGYPDELVEYYSESLSEEQRDLFDRSLFYFGTVFPNMSIIHGIQSGGWGGPWACIRKWTPRGPGKTETTSWWLIPKELAANEEFLENSHRGWESLSPGGAFESDDLPVWKGISDSTQAVTLEFRETEGVITQGMEGMSDEVEPVEDPMHGPGEVTTKGIYFDERNARNLLKAWHEMMSDSSPETTRTDQKRVADGGCNACPEGDNCSEGDDES